MKKFLLIAGIGVIGTGVAFHAMHPKKCPLGIIKSHQQVAKAKTETAVVVTPESQKK